MNDTNSRLIALAFLKQDSYWQLNKALCREIGFEAALLMSDLVSKFEYFEKKNLLTDDGFFYNTTQNICEDLGFSKYMAENSIKVLKSEGLIDVCVMGLPAKKHFRINFSALISKISQLTDEQSTSRPTVSQLVSSKSVTNNNKENKNKEISLNINAETSSADVKDLFGNEVKVANGVKPKQAKKKKVSTANPAHQMIKKFWYEEFSKGERWNSGSGTFINEIILNINSLISERGGEVSPEITFDFFKTICNQKKMSKSSFVYSAGLSTLSSPNHFKSIIEIIEKENGQQQFNQRGYRAGVTDFRFNVSDPRIKHGQDTEL